MLDAVVIGCGGVGSFALRAASQRVTAVLGVEQYAHTHNRGSSHGGSRIYRKAYFEHSNYVPWIQYSERVFKELGGADNDLLDNCGTLIMEERNGPVIRSCLKSARDHGIDVEVLPNETLRERYPQFKLYSNDTMGLLEPGGGFVRPERAMRAALEEAKRNGATIWENTTVKALNECDSHVELVLDREGDEELVQSKSVIVTAGAWTSTLIPSWKPHLKVTRQLQGWIRVSSTPNPSLYQPVNMPTWYMSTPASSLPLYGIPADPKSDNPHWMKLGLHLRPEILLDPRQNPSTLTGEELVELDHASSTALHSTLTFASVVPCLYTMTPDHHFLLGRASQRIVCAAGLSGHGFKMTPALGQMLVDMVFLGNEAEQKWKVDFCSPGRFLVKG